MSTVPQIFDRNRVRQLRTRTLQQVSPVSFLVDEVATRLATQLSEDIALTFPRAVIMGDWNGVLTHQLPKRFGSESRIQLDTVPTKQAEIIADPELLPLQKNSVDCIISLFQLHTVNDLPGMLAQCVGALRDKGLFVAVFLGEGSLKNIREVVQKIELEQSGGISARFHPLLQLRDGAALLQRAGFHLPVADLETIEVRYRNITTALLDIRFMGEGNSLVERSRSPLKRSLLAHADELLGSPFITPFDVITITGWKS